MDKLLEFSLDPTPESYTKIVGSKKTQNILGDTFTAWHPAVILEHYNDPVWEHITKEFNKEKLEKEMQKNHIDVVSKLVASPRLGLLCRAWGLFLATGHAKYLQIAFETAGNSRASNSVKSIAIKFYQDMKDIYNEVENSCEVMKKSPCFEAFVDMEDKILGKQKVLKELENENLLRRYVAETEQVFPNVKEEIKETVESLKDDKKNKEIEEVFNEVANRIFNKIV